jgi:hypothetical protein
MSIDTSRDGAEPAPVGPTQPDEPGDGVARLVHPRAIRWLHWINFPLLFIMMWSGLRIYWAHDVYAFGIGVIDPSPRTALIAGRRRTR